MNRKDLEKNILKVKNNTLFTSDLLYKDAIYEIEEAFKKKPFRIAVVGQFSSGKSTFINALIGKDILLHATEETTAALTSIHNVAQNDRMWHCCDITFNDGKSEHLKDDESLLDYTTTKSKITNVVSNIKSVDYYTDFTNPSTDIVLVDTPGLNGMADGHRELTIAEVRKSEFCIYLIDIRGLSETDKVILKELSYYQKNFLFIINFIDQLKTSEGESLDDKIQEIKDYLDKDIFVDSSIEYDIYGVSALKGLVGRDKEIKTLYQHETQYISDDYREKLFEESNMRDVINFIEHRINNETIDALSVDRVQHMLINIIDLAVEDLQERWNRIELLRKESGDNKKIQHLENKLNYFIESSRINEEKVINFAISECAGIRKGFMDYIKDELNEISRKYKDIINDFKKYEDLETYVKTKQLESEVKVDADKLYDYVEENILYNLDGLLNDILNRIENYLKGKNRFHRGLA